MIPEKIKGMLRRQHYRIVGKHSAVQICRWTKKSIKNEGVCYKEKFYGIDAHKCCQMTPAVMWCPNKCVHCWRAIENTIDEKLPEEGLDSPSEIIDGCIAAQRKLIEGFKINPETEHKSPSRADMKKFEEAQEPTQFAISLSGEPTVYKHLGGLIEELRNRGKTSFLVTNGLYPEKIQELINKNQLPTQLYVSVNSSNKELYDKFHRSCKKDAWEKLNETLSMLKDINCRNVFRMNLVKDLNMKEEHVQEYAEMIEKYQPMFVEVKGFMSVGYARERLGYERMPTHEEIKEFSQKIADELKESGYKILDEKKESCVLVLGKDKEELKIKKTHF